VPPWQLQARKQTKQRNAPTPAQRPVADPCCLCIPSAQAPHDLVMLLLCLSCVLLQLSGGV
jgi:hypothetical protein